MLTGIADSPQPSQIGGRGAVSNKYLTTEEVAELCRTSPETVRYWKHVGKGPKSFKLGRRVLYAADDVEAFIEAARKDVAVA